MDERPPAIEAIGLGRDYGLTRALDTLDLHVSPGSSVGLLGPNGAGKTTTMLLLATLLTPSRGSARVFGHDVTLERAAIRRRLGLVFQEPSIDGLLTVQENLLFAARLAGMDGSSARRAVAAAIARAGLAAHAAKPARQLSTGWRRLTDLVRALLHGPDLLILDEPTVGLDPEHRDRVWTLLESERSTRGTTLVFSTHYLPEAERCDYVVLLARGRAVGAGTPLALKAVVGDEIVEVEGLGSEEVVALLQNLATIRVAIKTERGYRVGVHGPREGLAQLTSVARQFRSMTIRSTTLEDVYFALTQKALPLQNEKQLAPGRA